MQHMDRSGIEIVPDARTATGVIMLDNNGECQCMVADMGVHDRLQPQQVENHRQSLATAPLVIMDCNVPFETMEHTLDICLEHRVPD
ncbi:pseudouridine kinase-like [Uloborus diversus]|uniref:pseudouridine kinase-like n=1 Tax=Uloborus diversus TaxID=327109 RepID=UPI0024096FFA|nr:pseudouridine kinase-like [Uloborus diversus]